MSSNRSQWRNWIQEISFGAQTKLEINSASVAMANSTTRTMCIRDITLAGNSIVSLSVSVFLLARSFTRSNVNSYGEVIELIFLIANNVFY